MKVRQIIDRCFEDPEFREQVVGDNIKGREDALAPYFEDDPEGLEEALGALNRILDSPSRDAIVEFSRWTDHTVEFAP
ncbi:MAG: hypothetical protein GWN58_19560 [Anaerolineae bacterium]|nr:hypothetical protein [Anaerolineae bacterium]